MTSAARLAVLLLVLGAGLSATDSWMGPANGGSWNTGSNWSDGVPPNATEIADLSLASSLTIPSGTAAVAASIIGSAAITISSGGSLTVSGSINASSITMSGGTLANAIANANIIATA